MQVVLKIAFRVVCFGTEKIGQKLYQKLYHLFGVSCNSLKNKADVAELADAHDLGSCGVTRGGSSPLIRTNNIKDF